MPGVIANEIIGVQPMTGSAGTIFTVRPTFGNIFKTIKKIKITTFKRKHGVNMQISVGDTSAKLMIIAWIQESFKSKDYYIQIIDEAFTYISVNVYSKEAELMIKMRWEGVELEP